MFQICHNKQLTTFFAITITIFSEFIAQERMRFRAPNKTLLESKYKMFYKVNVLKF